MRALAPASLVITGALLLAGCASPQREAAAETPTAAPATASDIATPSPSTTPSTVASEVPASPVTVSQDDAVSDSVGLRYVARLCIVNHTTAPLQVHWENAELTWRNSDMAGNRANHTVDAGMKTCGAGYRITDQPDAPGNPMAIDQMNVWATFTSPLQTRETYRVGADSRTTTGVMQAGVSETPGMGDKVYGFPVGEQRGWTLSEMPMVLERLPNDDRRGKWGPMAMFTLTVGRS